MPWRETTDPYRIFVSEVMLQQTQVPRVLEKYPSFLKRFPSIHILAAAPLNDVLREWQGMGYNRRGLYLKRAAEIIVAEYGGKIPQSPESLEQLPGVGRYTARAICAFAFGHTSPLIETNIRRVFIHHFFADKENVRDKEIMPLVEKTLPPKNKIRDWYWALMDYGSLAIPKGENPNKKSAHYVRQKPFEGSRRSVRALILKTLLNQPYTETKLIALVGKEAPKFSREEIQDIIREIKKEDLVAGTNVLFVP